MIGCIAGVVGLVDDVEGFAEGDVLSTGVLGAAARWGGVAPARDDTPATGVA